MIRALGSTSRTWASASSMVVAMSAPSAWLDTAILAATRSSSGPRCTVRRWMTRSTPGASSRAVNLVDLLGYGGLPDEQAGGLPGQENRDSGEQDADAEACDAVEDAVAGQDGEPRRRAGPRPVRRVHR